jgi:uroporphyrin-III C-methyltransferase/precorrin-2 dehydrogenase/sirohydrochlorin ferrochelatase
VSVHVPPGDERSTVNWQLLGGSSGTLVLLMAVERIGAVTAELLRYGRNPDTPVSVIADGTLPTQRTISSTLEQVEGLVAKEGIRPPAVVVVGDVVSVATEITELMRDVTPDEGDKLRVPGDQSGHPAGPIVSSA